MKHLTINPATILCQHVIHDTIAEDVEDLADKLAKPAHYYFSELQTIWARLTVPVWHGAEVANDHTSLSFINTVEARSGTSMPLDLDNSSITYAMAIIHLVRELFGANVAADISPYLLNPSMIGWGTGP